MKIAVLASGEGTTLQALIDAQISIALVISNNSDSGALRRATKAGIAIAHISTKTHPDPDTAIAGALQTHRVDLVVLAGYMKKVGPLTLAEFEGQIINTHPALLPKFGGRGMYGIAVHKAVLDAGEKTTGATVHVVDANYDEGPILAQREVEVLPGDTPESLAERVQTVERKLLTEVVLARTK